jgi:hypothetical protein
VSEEPQAHLCVMSSRLNGLNSKAAPNGDSAMENVMRCVIARALVLDLSVLVALPVGAQQPSYEAQWESYVDGARYRSSLQTQDIAATPRWDDSQPTPPLAARAAIGVARECLGNLDLSIRTWDVDSIVLRPAGDEGHWYYQIVFAEQRETPGTVRTFTIFVLMNGVAAVPRVIPQ